MRNTIYNNVMIYFVREINRKNQESANTRGWIRRLFNRIVKLLTDLKLYRLKIYNVSFYLFVQMELYIRHVREWN